MIESSVKDSGMMLKIYRRDVWNCAGVVAGVVVMVMLCGCVSGEKRRVGRESIANIGYGELVEKYNARVARIDRLWARAVVTLRWVDRDGKKQWEQGDGHLIIRKPDEIALEIGKAGKTFMWLGGDSERYWFFDLKPPKGEVKRGYVGSRKKNGLAGMKVLPVPVSPNQLIEFIGITELPVVEPAGMELVVSEGEYRLTFAGEEELSGLRVRRWIDGERFRLVRVVLIDENERVVIEARLRGWELMKLVGVAKGGWPYVATRIDVDVAEIETPDGKPVVAINLERSGMTNDGKKIKDIVFDFDRLVRVHNVEEVVDLDTRVEEEGWGD